MKPLRDPSGGDPSVARRTFLSACGGAFAGLAGCGGIRNGGSPYPGETTMEGPPVLEPHPDVSNPVLTAEAVTDRPFAAFVADPFLAVSDGTYHMFFEVEYLPEVDASADIAHATSEDGLTWEYEGIVLDDPYHLAYPYVFRHDGDWYMAPDKATFRFGGVPEFRLYRADPFPSDWTLAERAVVNEHFGDPTPIRYGGTWFLFSVEQERVHGTRLHYAETLRDGAWTEHPASPIATAARNRRPAGRPIVLEDGLYCFFQDVERTYGDKVRCFRVDTLTETTYEHSELSVSPVLASTGDGGWRGDGMHHVDPSLAYTGVENVVAVDGKDANGEWSIGIYRAIV